ncbi:hypothetical protein FRB94_005890 [Tulasnella sp. JGI-2019a]|nr:hypothetical protein FRB93_008215 [Tulasnella sp. JGI-2019a]KAG8999832.1 hypothetical protein FRB94_005890 [Tulasnella sp. JGI-2019a]
MKAWPTHKVAYKAAAATRSIVDAHRNALLADYQATTSLPRSTFPHGIDPKALRADLLNWTTVHRGSVIRAAMEGLSVYRSARSRTLSHCVIVTLNEHPGFDQDSPQAATQAAKRFIVSDIIVKDFDAARREDLAEEQWEMFDTYRKRVLDSKDADPMWVLLWLVCKKKPGCPFMQMMPMSFTRRD